MQQQQQQDGASSASLVEIVLDQQRVMLDREEKLRQEAQAEKAQLRIEMQQQIATLRQELQPPPPPTVTQEQVRLRTTTFCAMPFYTKKPNICQDRLGTDLPVGNT